MNISTSQLLGHSLVSYDALWNKGGSQSSVIEENFKPSMPSIPKYAQIQPDWNRIPSKSTGEMSEEEFEEAIRALVLENAGKSPSEIEKERAKLLMEYVSVASPDRKAAYEKFDGRGDAVYGDSNQKMLSRGADGKWGCDSLTKEEQARVAKFNEIYISAVKEYEAEHGQSSYTASAKTTYNPYSQHGGYNSSAYYSLYNALA